MDLWQVIEDEVEASVEFEADSLPTSMIEGAAKSITSGSTWKPDIANYSNIPEYLLVVNANKIDFSEEELKPFRVKTTTNHAVSVSLTLFQYEHGRWSQKSVAASDGVAVNELAALNGSARDAVRTVIRRWRAKQPLVIPTTG